MPAKKAEALNLLTDLVARAKRAGADAADALLVEGTSISASQRLGEPEKVERSESSDVGLRVFIGRRQAVVSSTDMSKPAMEALVERAVGMARAVPEDPDCGLAAEGEITKSFPDLDSCDLAEPNISVLVARAKRAEAAAMAIEGVTNSEGAEAGWGKSSLTIAASNGFNGFYTNTRHSLIVAVLAGEGTGMERDYEYMSAVYGDDLKSPEEIGRSAGERAVKRLNPRKAKSQKVPVVFDPRVSNTLVNHLAGAINGAAIARGTSFLKGKLEEPVFSCGITIVDDPLRKRGLRSRPFDAEGIATERRKVVDDGILKTWLLDLRSARKLKMHTTGHAVRGTSSPPSPAATNLYMEPGELTPKELIAGISSGFYVTELMGFGLNAVTGDYSRGASGFWIEDGEITVPVAEVTVAGNLKDMYRNMTAANDLEFRYGVDAPTVRIEGLMVAGE
jgi:PmbA protein